MKATEARKINDESESIDNSKSVLWSIERAAARRERSVEVSRETMTGATRNRLKELGYFISRSEKPSPSYDDWTAKETVWIVSW